MKCEYCREEFSEDELDSEGYCQDCNDLHKCNECGCYDDLDEDGVCESCNIEYAISMREGRWEV